MGSLSPHTSLHVTSMCFLYPPTPYKGWVDISPYPFRAAHTYIFEHGIKSMSPRPAHSYRHRCPLTLTVNYPRIFSSLEVTDSLYMPTSQKHYCCVPSRTWDRRTLTLSGMEGQWYAGLRSWWNTEKAEIDRCHP